MKRRTIGLWGEADPQRASERGDPQGVVVWWTSYDIQKGGPDRNSRKVEKQQLKFHLPAKKWNLSPAPSTIRECERPTFK